MSFPGHPLLEPVRNYSCGMAHMTAESEGGNGIRGVCELMNDTLMCILDRCETTGTLLEFIFDPFHTSVNPITLSSELSSMDLRFLHAALVMAENCTGASRCSSQSTGGYLFSKYRKDMAQL